MDSKKLITPLGIGIASFVVGLLIGLIVLGWWIWPVQWTDAAPGALQETYRVDYLRMAVEAYAVDGDAQIAKVRWDGLGDTQAETMTLLKQSPAPATVEQIAAYETAVGVSAGAPPAPTEEAPAGRTLITTLIIVMCVVTLLLGGALVVFFVLQGRRAPATKTPLMEDQEAARQAEMTDYAAMGEEAPMAQFMASYRIGDDLFDDSFSIDSPTGEFLGECGVGISETIGVGDPKKVTAFEVWLFDKNDIQTVTKVLMSAHAFEDTAIRQRLEAKGEPFQIEPGSQVVLETATLRLVARVVDMTYGEGALPESSFFEGLVLELAIWQK